MVRTERDPAALTTLVRETVRGIDRAVAVDSIVTMEDRLHTGLAQPRLYAVVLGVFAGFTLLLAASGLFGVLSYSVGCRTREIGVRAALGARPIQIVALVLRQEVLIAALVVAVCGAAAVAPIRRATRVDPIRVLKAP